MSSIRIRGLILVFSILVLWSTGAWAAGKSHVVAPVGQILNLRAFAPNDNSGGHTFSFDQSGPDDFTVPEKMVFVVTDVRIVPNLSSFLATQSYLVIVNFDNGGSRFLSAAFLGASYDRSFTTGFVIPSGATPTARNTTGSFEDVSVFLQGYLIKGQGLPANTAFPAP